MPWQDIVLMMGNIVFVFSLFPSILTKDKPSVWTSGISTVILYLFVVTYHSLGLWGSAIATLAVGICWNILAVQKFFSNRNSK